VDIHSHRNVPDWQFYALIGTIEVCRTGGRNPELPEGLKPAYDAAWARIIDLACRDLPGASDETTVQSILGAIALAKGIQPLGEIILDFSGEELAAMIAAYRGG
jgi:hypothetical protein